MVIKITVANKRPTVDGAPIIVCGNSDYAINFTFDAEWNAQALKTARFVFYKDGVTQYQDVAFSGNTVAVPVLSGIREVYVGVYAGDLRTTTPARIPCDKSILCGTGTEHEAPDPGIYNQILAACNELIGATGNHPNLKNNPHGVTASQIGAAPAGYGLGAATKNVTSWDDAKVCGWYRSNGNTPNGYYWVGYVTTNGTSIVQQIFYPVSGANWQCIRSSADGGTTWGEWEWVNPPMKPGIEYRTTERWDGKAVYAKLLDAGAFPNASYKSVDIGATITDLVDLTVTAVWSDGSWRYTLPIYGTTGTLYCMASVVDRKYVRIYAVNYDASAYTGKILIKYTKD